MRETRRNMTLCIFSPIVYVYSLLRRSLIVRCSNTYINRSECRHVYRVCKTVSANNFEALENNCNVGGESTRLPSETNTLFTQSLYHHVSLNSYVIPPSFCSVATTTLLTRRGKCVYAPTGFEHISNVVR